MPLYMITGAYEPPKAAKQRATITYTRMPLKYKFILSKYGKCASIGTGYCYIHTWIATPSSAFEFVFRWHASYTLLCRLRRLICSWLKLYTPTIFVAVEPCGGLYRSSSINLSWPALQQVHVLRCISATARTSLVSAVQVHYNHP